MEVPFLQQGLHTPTKNLCRRLLQQHKAIDHRDISLDPEFGARRSNRTADIIGNIVQY